MERDYTIEDWREAFFAIDRNIEKRKKYINKFNSNKNSRIVSPINP